MLTDDECRPGISDEAEGRLSRLIGDSSSARCKIEKLRTITNRMDKAKIDRDAEILKAMADPCRLMILSLLREGEFCVCEIMTALDRPQSTTSHHLSILRDAGLIRERKDGKWSRYRLSEGAVIEIMSQVSLLNSRDDNNGANSVSQSRR